MVIAMAVDTQGKASWTGKDVSGREINLLNQRVIQFTDIEDTFLDVWLQLENANLDELAAKVLNAGLLFEHYLSQLPNDPTQRDPEEIAQLESYRSDAGTALDEGRAALASVMTTGATGSTMTSSLASTAVKTGTLTFWSYLAFQEYLAVAAGNLLSVVGFGVAAVAELFLGFWLAGYKGVANRSSGRNRAKDTS